MEPGNPRSASGVRVEGAAAEFRGSAGEALRRDGRLEGAAAGRQARGRRAYMKSDSSASAAKAAMPCTAVAAPKVLNAAGTVMPVHCATSQK